ncbi:hypothetical protein AB6A40_010592 [Gnathostoma spinigerum]|uniref:Uncharacterized protein n=1 Tax=Gnathostoma spinigerum TaxID=75299 RepID=A0ABD6EVR1_9BILA
MQCSYEEDDHDEWIDEQIYHDKGYYDEICALLYRYRQVELGQLEHEQEAERKKQVKLFHCSLFTCSSDSVFLLMNYQSSNAQITLTIIWKTQS